METLPHPAYIPDLAPCDFFWFPHAELSCLVNSTQYNFLGSAIFRCLLHIPKTEFKMAFLQWVERF